MPSVFAVDLLHGNVINILCTGTGRVCVFFVHEPVMCDVCVTGFWFVDVSRFTILILIPGTSYRGYFLLR